MGDFGAIIDPYRVAPPSGDLLTSILQFAAMNQDMQRRRAADVEQGATNQMINQANGWQGVDPFKVQAFDTQNSQNRLAVNADQRAGAAENRAQQTFDDNRQFASDYIRNVQPQLVGPYLGGFAGVQPNPAAAQAIMGFLGQQAGFNQEQIAKRGMLAEELKNRLALNEADNAAALARAQAVAGIQSKAAVDEINAKQGLIDKNREANYAKALSGLNGEADPMAVAMANGLDANQTMLFLQEADKRKLGRESAATAEKLKQMQAQEAVRGLPMTQEQVKSSRDEAWNQKHKFWNHLPEGEFNRIYALDENKQPYITPKGRELLDQIAAQIRYNDASMANAAAASSGASFNPYVTRSSARPLPGNPGIPLSELQKIIPHIVAMVKANQ